MTVDATDVQRVLPEGRRYGSVEVVDVETFDDFDSEGEDAIRIVLTLASPPEVTWKPGDVLELEAMIRRGLIAEGEDRAIIFWLRPQSDDNDDESPATACDSSENRSGPVHRSCGSPRSVDGSPTRMPSIC